jgi:hypothetical protein
MTTASTVRLTMAQALIRFLKNQYVEHDGVETPFFAGCFGIFGHGCVAGVGEALLSNPDFRYYQVRNEQGAVHAATAYAKVKNRLQTFACLSSIGPGATNMITGAATATINRLPVLDLAGRHLRPPQRGAGAAAARIGAEPGLLGQRLLQARQQVLGPHQPARPVADRAARGDARAHQPQRDGRGDALPAAGCADRSLRLPGGVLPQARLAHHAQPRRPRRAGQGGRDDPRGQAADDRGGRRRDLRRCDRDAA